MREICFFEKIKRYAVCVCVCRGGGVNLQFPFWNYRGYVTGMLTFWGENILKFELRKTGTMILNESETLFLGFL